MMSEERLLQLIQCSLGLESMTLQYPSPTEIEQLASALLEAKKILEGDCICHGNFRQIIRESEALLGRQFKDSNGKTFSFFGIVWGDDDFYYGMSGADGMILLSCVGNLETHGFELIDQRLAQMKGEKDGEG